EVCSAEVRELRRGRCWGCYSRWVEARPVGLGAKCCLCSERRRDALRSVEILGAWRCTCYNCAARATKLSPMPATLAELRRALDRERRRIERRVGTKDSRVFQYERRKGERRTGEREEWSTVVDDMILERSGLESTSPDLAEQASPDPLM